MTYQKFMKKIMEELQKYKLILDEISDSYLAEVRAREDQLEEMQGKFLPEYIKEFRENWKPKTNYAEIIEKARTKHQKIADSHFDQIKKELDAYFRTPVDPGFSATVSAAKNLGLTLSNREFEILQGAANGYWNLRLLNELGVSRTKPEQKAVLEKGELRREEGEKRVPYTGTPLPDIENAYASFREAQNTVSMAFDNYCGEGNVLKDIIFPISKSAKQTNKNIQDEYGLNPPEPTRDAMTISMIASAPKLFNEDYIAYTDFLGMMNDIAATMPASEKRTELTEADKRLIDAVIDDRYPSLANNKAVEIAKINEDMAEILLLDSRYAKSVEEALQEVDKHE